MDRVTVLSTRRVQNSLPYKNLTTTKESDQASDKKYFVVSGEMTLIKDWEENTTTFYFPNQAYVRFEPISGDYYNVQYLDGELFEIRYMNFHLESDDSIMVSGMQKNIEQVNETALKGGFLKTIAYKYKISGGYYYEEF